MSTHGPLRVGIGGPVGSGKTALTLALCRRLREKYDIAAVTNDIYTREDAEFLVKNDALPKERILGVETGGGPPPPPRQDGGVDPRGVDRPGGAGPGAANRRSSSSSRGATTWPRPSRPSCPT